MAPKAKTPPPAASTPLDRPVALVEPHDIPWPTGRVPLAHVQLAKPIERYSLYASKHDVITHNSPPGLRVTLVDNHFVMVESPLHQKDERRAKEGKSHINFRIPISSGLVLIIEDLVPRAHRFDPAEHLAYVRSAVERTNHLSEVEPPEEYVKAKVVAGAKGLPPPSPPASEGKPSFTIGAHTNNEQELLDDEMADERAEANSED